MLRTLYAALFASMPPVPWAHRAELAAWLEKLLCMSAKSAMRLALCVCHLTRFHCFGKPADALLKYSTTRLLTRLLKASQRKRASADLQT